MRKIILQTVVIMLILILSSCSESDEYKNEYVDDIDKYFYDTFNIEATDEKISLEQAKENYVTCYGVHVVYPPHNVDCAEFMKYTHSKVEVDEYVDCFIFDIEGYEDLKFYAYFVKNNSNVPELVHTLFVDEAFKNTEVNLNIGDDLDTIKKEYPNVQLLDSITFKEPVIEILDKNGVYSYDIDKNNKICSKYKLTAKDSYFECCNR